MANNKDPEPKVEFSDNKPLDSKGSSRKWKVPLLIGILTAILLLGAVVSVSVYFSLKKQPHLDWQTLIYKKERL